MGINEEDAETVDEESNLNTLELEPIEAVVEDELQEESQQPLLASQADEAHVEENEPLGEAGYNQVEVDSAKEVANEEQDHEMMDMNNALVEGGEDSQGTTDDAIITASESNLDDQPMFENQVCGDDVCQAY